MRKLFFIAGLVLAVTAVASIARASTNDRLYLYPGQLVDVGGYRLNLLCAGAGSPAVVFDAGLEDWSPSWSRVQPAIAATTRTCTYDRAGNGWSDTGPAPRTSAQIVSELHELLGVAGIAPPYILVGHSFGGYNMRLFADRYLDETAGIVLVDSSHEDQERAVAAATPGSEREWRAMISGLGACRTYAAAHDERSAFWSTKAGAACIGQFFRGLPERTFSARLNAVLLREARSPKQYGASLSEAQSFRTTSAAEVRRARRSFGSIPLRILTGTHHFSDTAATSRAQRGRERRFERDWQALQRSWLALSTNSRQVLARASGHYVQLDQPQLVITAIRDEIATVRGAVIGMPAVWTASCTRGTTRPVKLLCASSGRPSEHVSRDAPGRPNGRGWSSA